MTVGGACGSGFERLGAWSVERGVTCVGSIVFRTIRVCVAFSSYLFFSPKVGAPAHQVYRELAEEPEVLAVESRGWRCWRRVSNVVAAVPRWCLRFVVAVVKRHDLRDGVEDTDA